MSGKFRSVALKLAGMVVLACAPAVVRAEPLALGAALEKTLSLSPAVQVQRVLVDSASGSVQAAAGTFDWTTSGTYTHALNKSPTFSSTTFQETEDITRARALVAGVSRKFRNSAQLDVTNTIQTTRDKSLAPLGPVGQAKLALSVTVPLLKGFGTDAATATERAALSTLNATRYSSGYEISSEVYNVAVLYWSSRALDRNTAILEDTFTRARTTATLLEERLRGGLMAPVEYQRSLAELQLREIDVDEGRQKAQEGRSKLAAQMGQADKDGLPTAANPFPDPAPLEAIEALQVASLIEYALSRRLDLKSLEQQIEAARINLFSAQDNLLPQLDLKLSRTYHAARAQYQHTELEDLYDGSDKRSPTTSIMVTFSYPLGNNAAHGTVTTKRAALNNLELDLVNLRSSIHSEVAIAHEKLRSARLAYDKAVSSQQVMEEVANITMDNLTRGESTMTDLISVENRLTEARLKVIDNQSKYAQALAQLRFTTGSLTEGVNEAVTVDPEALLTLPRIAAAAAADETRTQ